MQWEYHRLSACEASLDEALRELGLDGWELVSVVAEARLFHGFQCVLKRPRAVAESDHGKPPASTHRVHKLAMIR